MVPFPCKKDLSHSFSILVLSALGTEDLACHVKPVEWPWTLLKGGNWRERKNVLTSSLNYHSLELISSAYSECLLFFSFHMFLSFVGTMFYRMSWCITYCTYHSAADIIYTLIKSALGISVQLSAVGTHRAPWLIYGVAEYYGWQALSYLGCCAFTRRTLRACSACVPRHT